MRGRSRRALAKLEPLNFSGGRLRKLGQDLDPAWIFPLTDALFHMVLKRLEQRRIVRGAGSQDDERLGLLEPVLVPRGDDCGFENRRMRDQRLLDLEGRNPDASDLEHVVDASAVDEAPARLAFVLVAGSRPRALERRAAALALVPVIRGGGGALDQEFADLAGADIAARIVDYADLIPGHGDARGAVINGAAAVGEE